MTAFLYPLSVNEYIACGFERSPLSNQIGLHHEQKDDTFWNKYILKSKIEKDPIDFQKLLGSFLLQISNEINCEDLRFALLEFSYSNDIEKIFELKCSKFFDD
jgi:hypothetical protein